jgi:hypothetical protein
VLDPQRQKQIGVWQIREIGAYDVTAQISKRLLTGDFFITRVTLQVKLFYIKNIKKIKI